MITLSEIWVYPVKSMAGVRVTAARIDARGLEGDRRFMVVDPRGRFVTQRQQPTLALLRPRLEADQLVVEAPGGAAIGVPRDVVGEPLRVEIWGDALEATDAGDTPAKFLSRYLGSDVRLVRLPAASRRPADLEHAREGDEIAFQDGFPFLLIGEASLDALNERLGFTVDMRRFRPNLVVRGAEAFAEDAWTRLTVGQVEFHGRKRCPRCVMVDVDPDRGEATQGVLRGLASFRTLDRAARFGQNLVHDGPGTIEVGDRVVPTTGGGADSVGRSA